MIVSNQMELFSAIRMTLRTGWVGRKDGGDEALLGLGISTLELVT